MACRLIKVLVAALFLYKYSLAANLFSMHPSSGTETEINQLVLLSEIDFSLQL